MQEEFQREQLIKEKTELDREIELIKNIIKTAIFYLQKNEIMVLYN